MGMDSVFKVSLVLDMIDNMTSKVNSVADTVQGSVGGMTSAFEGMQKAGLAMTGAGTAITTACLSTVTATFDTQNALGELASLGVEDLAAVEKAAKGFSDQWAGTSKADFITASYDIKSGIASLSDEGVAQFTELAALTGKATKSTTEEMGSLFATGYGIYKDFYGDMSDLEFGEMFSAGIATAVKNYKTSGTQMADAISKLGATATNANVPMEEQLAILGQLQTTMSGSEAATKYNAFLQSAAGAGEKLGLSFVDANNQLLSTPEILETLKGKYGETLDAMEKQELKEAFGTDEAIKYIDLLYNKTDDLKGGISDLHDSMEDGITVTEGMAEAINNTPEQKFEVMKQKVHNTVEALGSGLLPAVNNALDGINNMIQKGSDWVSNNQETVSTIMNIVLYLGIFLIAAGALTTTIGTLGKTISGFSSVFGGIKRAISGAGFLSALGPIALIAGAVIGLIAVFEACGGDVSKLQGTLQGVFGSIGGIISGALGVAAEYLPGFLQFGIDLLSNVISGIAEQLPILISSGSDMITSITSGIAEALPGITQSAVQILGSLLSTIISGLPGLLSAGTGMILSILSGIGTVLPSIVDMASQLIMAFLSTLVSGLPSLLSTGVGMISSILSGIVQLLPTVIQSGIAMVLNLLSGIAQNLPSLLSAGGQLILTLLSGIVQLLPTILSGGLSIIGNLASGILQGIPALVEIGGSIVNSIWTAITETDWLAIGGDMINGIKDGFMSGFESLVDSVKGAWGKFTDWLSGGGGEETDAPEVTSQEPVSLNAAAPQVTAPTVQTTTETTAFAMPEIPDATATTTIVPEFQIDLPGYEESGQEWMAAFTAGIESGAGDAQQAAQTAATGITDILTAGTGMDTEGLGTDLMSGLTTGIEGSGGDIQQAAETATASLESILASGTGIDTEGLGTDLMSGLAAGIENNSGTATTAASMSVDDILASLDDVDTSNASTIGGDIINSFGTGISDNASAAASAAQETIAAAMSSLQTIDTSTTDTLGSDIMSSLGDSITGSSAIATGAAEEATSSITEAFNPDTSAMAEGVNGAAETVTTTVDTLSTHVTSQMETCWNSVQSTTTAALASVVSATQNGISTLRSAWSSGMSSINSAVSSGMSNVRNTAVGQATSIASQIRSAFANIRVTVPAPSLPHISVSYNTVGSGNATAQVPNFSVSYHAEGGIMTAATLLGISKSGTAHVGGEAGEEAILPLDTLWTRMKQIVSDVVGNESKKTDGEDIRQHSAARSISEKIKSQKAKGETKKEGGNGRGDRKNYVNKFVVNVDMGGADSVSKLLKLLDELDSPETDPELA